MSQSKPLTNTQSKSPDENLLQSAWKWYLTQLQHSPLATKSITAGSIAIIGSVLSNYAAGGSLATIDLQNLRNQAIIGATRGAVVHYWYGYLESIVRSIGSTFSPTVQALLKMLIDQLGFAPIWTLAYFYLLGALQGRSSSFISAKVAAEYGTVLRMNYKIWPAVNFLNFLFVPPQLRVLVGNIVGIFWVMYVVKITAQRK